MYILSGSFLENININSYKYKTGETEEADGGGDCGGDDDDDEV